MEPEKLNLLLKTDYAEVEKKNKTKTVTNTYKSRHQTCSALNEQRYKFSIITTKISSNVCRPLSEKGESCPVALFKIFCRAKTSMKT